MTWDDFLESAKQSSTENKTLFFKKSFSAWAPGFKSLLASFNQGISLHRVLLLHLKLSLPRGKNPTKSTWQCRLVSSCQFHLQGKLVPVNPAATKLAGRLVAVHSSCTARALQAVSALRDSAFVPALVVQLNSSFACRVGPRECVLLLLPNHSVDVFTHPL